MRRGGDVVSEGWSELLLSWDTMRGVTISYVHIARYAILGFRDGTVYLVWYMCAQLRFDDASIRFLFARFLRARMRDRWCTLLMHIVAG